MAVSADGNTAIVGGTTDGFGGAAWVWTRSAGVWTQQGTKLVGSGAVGNAQQGRSVALSADGNTALVGGNGDNFGIGAAWVWTRSGGVWTQQGAKLVGSGFAGLAGQAFSVSLSADGNTALVGGPADNNNAGAVWVWARSGGVWSQQGAKLVGSGAVGDATQGYSVSLSGDGNTALIGGIADNNTAGAAWIWTRSAGVWTQPAGKLVGSGAVGAAYQGYSLSLSGDGTKAFVGGPNDNAGLGAAWAWSRSGGAWAQQGGKLIGSDTVGAAYLGYSVSISGDGNTAVVGGAGDNSQAGAVWMWTRNGVGWTQMGSKLVGSGGAGNASQGDSVALSAGGTTAIVGGSSDNNGAGAAWVFAASASTTPATPVTLDKQSLVFAAVSSSAAFTSQTPAQTVRLTSTAARPATWTATSTAPWLVVSPASGSGPATLTVSVQFTPGLTSSQTGRINLSVTGASNPAAFVDVTLTVVPSTSVAAGPFGSFDTPAGDATALAGSIAVTGWTLDDVGVQRVEIWRDLQPGETTPPFSSTPADPRHGKVFIGNATPVDGARPDVEALYPATPATYRAGWGYLLLTWGLFGQGNGTYQLHVFAVDQEGNTGIIGSKRVAISNSSATKPFGSIDTPGIGGDASGPNFGWALTPKVNGVATCKIPPSGVQVSIDSGPLQPVVYGSARPDIAGAFPGFSNTAGAGGHFIIDWSALTPGVHTIGWLITDDCNRADGVGSRFFNVTTGISAPTAGLREFHLNAETSSDTEFRLTADASPDADFRLKPEATQFGTVTSAFRRKDDDARPVLVSRGYGELPELVTPDEAGNRTIVVKQGGRIEIRVPRGFETAYQLVNVEERRAIPTGATWDAASGTFYWQPAPGFLGRYRIVFSNGSERISVRVVVTP